MTARRTAFWAGVLYLLTFVTSIPAVALKGGLLDDPGSASAIGPARTGAALELVLAAACVGTAVVLYPVVRAHGERAALGFVAARVLEASMILVGVLVVLTFAEGVVGEEVAPALVGLHDAAFLVGPGAVPALNALLLAPLLLRGGLVPRAIPLIGLVGAPLLLVSALGAVAGWIDQVSVLAGLLALPIAAWELSLGLWLLVRGFSTARVTPVGA
ncbi:DUF4386 domain-containing protein [Aeromicrobium sp. JJY06]|uniref:DUF4386 domain-containing protein n=1 Tax=Aeromicrobium sp. JJY06 TaxID=3373478 RepID=UPI00376F1176